MTGNRSLTEVEEEQSLGPQQARVVQASTSSSQSEDDASAITNDASVALVTPRNSSNNNNTKSSHNDSCVQVAVRVRPILSSLESGCGSCIQIVPGLLAYPTTIQIGPASGPTFTFDEVFPTTTAQIHVFEHKVAPLVERCLEGYNATILAYGQTGSGKTHTVIGPSTCHSSPEEESSGMIPRAVSSLFQLLQRKQLEMIQQQQNQQQQSSSSSAEKQSPPKNSSSTSNKPTKSTNSNKDEMAFEFQVRVQFLELYGEEIRDLLTSTSSTNSAGDKLTIRDIGNDEPEVVGATSQVVASAEEALRCLTKGMLRRVTAATAMNESSSRSHAIFSILVDQTWTNAEDTAVGPQVRRSKFNFVDLAGSERQKRTQAVGRRLKEGIDINKGLLVLGNVISALGDPKKRGKAFVPYRDSKLTRLLKGSLGGNHKTLMIACVSPASTNMEESLNCLRYANRAKNIQNHAIVNMDARSQMITELKVQVQALAKDLLRAKETGDPRGGSFTREALVTLVNGGSANGNPAASSTSMAPAKKASVPVTPAIRSITTPSPSNMLSPGSMQLQDENRQHQRLRDTEEELERSRTQLRLCRREGLVVEERLHVTKAEKEFYRLQLETAGSTMPSGESAGAPKIEMDQVFIDRASEYEKEISGLKDELRVVRGQLVEQREPEDLSAGFSAEKARQSTQAERERLVSIQKKLSSLGPSGSSSKSPFRERPAPVDLLEKVDAETKAEEEHLTALTLKYSHVEDEDEDEVMIVDQQNTPRVAESADLALPEMSSEQRKAQIEADFLEISRVIESKEELISQLQCSQAKYSSMREYYEGKLHEMEILLDQKEEERQKIITELDRLNENNHDTRELEEKLKRKDEHIAGIRKQKLQLKDLTAVSSKNAETIRKLQSDVKAMKERKVSMQKQLKEERKAHSTEIKMLKKEALQQGRETRKWQKISNQKTSEAEKASNVAKMKEAKLGQLRAKYKDAEKTIRMLQIKKGVMAKAGLDSVIVGRRGKEKSADQSRNPANERRSVDADSLRDYFDRKIAEVGRKEAIADKLARGWEEHLQLTLKRTELEEQDSETSREEIQALDLRIQYEEDRIRKLAHKLGKKQPSGDDAGQTSQQNSMLYGKEFKQLCKDLSAARATEIAAKVLFGMVVRERRRIASLAKTASNLDEKLQECQMDNEAKEIAFRSYVQDSQQDFANISMNHQEQILSLMSIVKSDGNNTDGAADPTPPPLDAISAGTDTMEGSKMLVLANERISVLEQQLRELKEEKRVSESYRLEKEEAKIALESKTEEYEKLEIRLVGLRATLRQVRDRLLESESKNDDTASTSALPDIFGPCLSVIREALLESPGPISPMARRHSCPNVFQPSPFSPQSQKQWEFMQGADDEEEDTEEETPDWADEIMADLFLIAEGQLPPSLKDVPDILDAEIDEKATVEPVRSPARQTGIPKPRMSASSSPRNCRDKQIPPLKRADEGLLKQADDGLEDAEPKSSGLLENLIADPPKKGSPDRVRRTVASKHDDPPPPDEILPVPSLKREGSAVFKSAKEKADKTVFERLVNPTHFTGVQKEKHHSQVEAQQEHLEQAADRMLDHLLESNSDFFGKRIDGEATGKRSSDVSAEAANKVKEYTQQNVFERLQKTTTQSFAVKHAPTLEDPDLTQAQEANSSQTSLSHKQDTAKAPRSSTDGRPKRVTPQASEHQPVAVEAIPMPAKDRSPSRPTKVKARSTSSRTKSPPKPTDSRGTSPARAKSPARQRTKDEYTQQNVFERLTKTTTEAYAVKKKGASKS